MLCFTIKCKITEFAPLYEPLINFKRNISSFKILKKELHYGH